MEWIIPELLILLEFILYIKSIKFVILTLELIIQTIVLII